LHDLLNLTSDGRLSSVLDNESEEPMHTKRRITPADVQQVGATLGLDWNKIGPGQFRRGLEAELKHGTKDPEMDFTKDELAMAGRIARANLKEFPDYYMHPDRLEAELAPIGRHAVEGTLSQS
jgi:hypothetical protein